ncbi:hypothetical protein pb186bvf_016724 [Paramecium bursaria]
MNQITELKQDDYDDIECTLPRNGEPCKLENFLIQEEADQITHRKGDLYNLQIANEIQKKIYIEEMNANPEDFFNFGFSSDDYFLFLIKYSVMRCERQVIEQKYTKYLKSKGIHLE